MADKCAICGTSDPKLLALCCHPQCPTRRDKPFQPLTTKPYKCTVCGATDPDTFARCYHPMCPDGHDQPGRFPSYPPAPLSLETRKSGRVVLLVILFAIISLIYACTSQIVLR